MRAIFISYRRDDTEGHAGRLFDDLVKHFGPDSVFMDVAGIEPGVDFRPVIEQHVASCGVLLALIGKNWIDARDPSGRRRLDDPSDFVRLETAAALKRNITVVPVLVQGATLPKPDQLPEGVKELAYRNAVELTHTRWDSDLNVLVKALSRHVAPRSPAPAPPTARRILKPATLLPVVIALLLALTGVGAYVLHNRENPASSVIGEPKKPAPEIPKPTEQTKIAEPSDHKNIPDTEWRSLNFPPPNAGRLAFKKMPDGNWACASYDQHGCLWGVEIPDLKLNELKPLVCGEMHLRIWGDNGYDQPGHWCNYLKVLATQHQ